MGKLILLILMVLASGLEARHKHLRSIMHEGHGDHQTRSDAILAEIDGIPIEIIRQMRPTRFVPVNNELFFKTYPPCADGFKRDFLGNCREVWDK